MAPAFSGVVDLPGPVGRDDHERLLLGVDRSQLGMEIWKSLSSSSRKASNSSSERSISSMSRTGGTFVLVVDGVQERTPQQELGG